MNEASSRLRFEVLTWRTLRLLLCIRGRAVSISRSPMYGKRNIRRLQYHPEPQPTSYLMQYSSPQVCPRKIVHILIVPKHQQATLTYALDLRNYEHTTMEQRITREDHLAGTILHKPTNTILRMTWCIQRFHFDISNCKTLSIRWRLGYAFAVFTTDYRFALEFGREVLLHRLRLESRETARRRKRQAYELFVSACMIPMTTHC
jgi:hypothetical protein